MENTPQHFLTLALPSIILYLAATGPSLLEVRPYREVFGNGDYFLDLYYETNPDGWLQPKNGTARVRFHGRLTTDQGEFPVAGERIGRAENAQYRFDSAAGQFQGRLRRGPHGCEPALDYRIERGNRVADSGILHAGFCL